MSKNTSICLTLISASFLFLCVMASGMAAAEDEPPSDDNVTHIYIDNGETFEVNLSAGGLGAIDWDLNDFDGSFIQLMSTTTWQDPTIAGYNDSWEQMIWTFKGLKDGEIELRFKAEFSHDDFDYVEVYIVTIGQGSNQLRADKVFRESESGSSLHFDTGEEFTMNFTWGEEDGYFFSDILFDNSTIQLLKSETIGPFGNSTTGSQYYRIWTYKAMKAGKTTLQFIRGDSATYTYTVYTGTTTVAIDEEEKETPGFGLPMVMAVLAMIAVMGWKVRKITTS